MHVTVAICTHNRRDLLERALASVSNLAGADDCTWDDVMQQIYVRQRIEAGLRDADEGRVLSHEDVFKKWE